MNEQTIRERVRSALGASPYPASLKSQIADRIAQPAEPQVASRWVMAAVAAFLAVAIVVTLVLGSERLLRPVPVHAPPFRVLQPGTPACVTGSCSVVNVLFASPKVGWVVEALNRQCNAGCPFTGELFRTDDGGFSWTAQLNLDHYIARIVASADGREVLLVPDE